MAITTVALLVGCASPGPPRPPSLHIPATVKDLTAERVADQVVLHWTSPDKTTDKMPIKGSATVVVCREVTPALAGSKPGTAACVEVDRLTVTTGEMQAVDRLPVPLTSDPVRLLSYRVTVASAAGRPGPASLPAFAAAGAAPKAVGGLRGSVVKGGTMLEWQRVDAGGAPVELTRVNPDIAVREAAQKSAAGRRLAAPVATAPKSRLQLRRTRAVPAASRAAEPAEIRLRAGDSDAGGTFDQTVVNGATYTYTAQRVRPVTVEGHELKLLSAVSEAVTIAVRDTFPPAVPVGLAAIPNARRLGCWCQLGECESGGFD